jgi:hypothetical protein
MVIITTIYLKEIGNETSGINTKQVIDFICGGDITTICKFAACTE